MTFPQVKFKPLISNRMKLALAAGLIFFLGFWTGSYLTTEVNLQLNLECYPDDAQEDASARTV